jgi:hypothetical protein
MCHSTVTEDLDVRPSILPASLWRCEICCHVWKESGAIRPLSDQPPFVNAAAPRRRKTTVGRRRSCSDPPGHC